MSVRPVPACFAIAALVGVAIVLGAGLSTLTAYGPDPVLLVVIAVGLAGGATYGSATGFCSGLLLDLAPYAANVVGTGALAFTVVGYLAGVVGARWRPAHWLLRLVRPVVLSTGGVVLVALAFAGFAALLDEHRFGLEALVPSLLPTGLATIALAPLLIPGTVGLLRKCA